MPVVLLKAKRKPVAKPAKAAKPVGRTPAILDALDVPTERRGPDGQPVLGADDRPEVRRARRGDLIAEAVSTGCTYKAATEMHGLCESAFYRAMAQGRTDKEAADAAEERGESRPAATCYQEFSEAVTRACAASEASLLVEIREICRDRGDARTLLELLGRRFPARWGRVDRMELTGADGEALVATPAADMAILEAAREVRVRQLERDARTPQERRGDGDGGAT